MSIKIRSRRRTRTRIEPRFFIIIGVLLAVIGVLLFIILYHGREEITERGTMLFTLKDRSAVLIRDETVLRSSEYARIDCLREEGSEVMAGESLATVYKLGYSDELMQSLLSAREDVYKAQMERIGSTKDPTLDSMNSAIAELRKKAGESVMLGTGGDLSGIYWQLDNALKERMDYLRGKVQETETLRSLYKTVDDRLELLSSWTETVEAPAYGAVSYYFDSYEESMNSEKLSMLSPDLINRAIKDKGSTQWSTGDRTRVCRIVDSKRWFIAFITSSDDIAMTASGVEYDVDIKGYGSFTGVGLEPLLKGSDVINIIEINAEQGELMNIRTATVNVSGTVGGIKVKSDAIKKDKGLRHIELLLSESHFWMRVDVLAEEDGMVIVRPHEESDTLNEGVRYWNRKR